jgi:vitamin K-dependent gamma-carboxylase
VKRLVALLNAPRDAAPLAAFRIVFGALMAFEAFAGYLHKIPDRYAPDVFHFTYPGFGWVTPPPGLGIYLVIGAMGLAAVCFTLGYRYRPAAIIFLTTYTYIFLIERAAYNNHYYLIILLAFLFTLVDANADAALDSSRRPPERRGWVPAWQIYIFRAQIVVVYFFGGVAKLSPDWLARQPITHWLGERAQVVALGALLEPAFVPYLLAYGGLLFDLSIGFLLLWRPTRVPAIVLVLFFHLTNAYLFSIGIFPWLGIGATVIFLEGSSVRRVLAWVGYTGREVGIPVASPIPRPRWPLVFCAACLTVQCVVPLRHWCYAGEVNWTEEGHDFSWHMKLRDKEGVIAFTVVDRASGRRDRLDSTRLAKELTDTQLREMSCKP